MTYEEIIRVFGGSPYNPTPPDRDILIETRCWIIETRSIVIKLQDEVAALSKRMTELEAKVAGTTLDTPQ